MCMLTSTAVLLRLFALPEGAGGMLISVPGTFGDLLGRVAVEPEVPGTDQMVLRGGRWVGMVEPETMAAVKDLLSVSPMALRRDRAALTEMLDRIAASGEEIRPLTRLEFKRLKACIGEGNWCRGIPVCVG